MDHSLYIHIPFCRHRCAYCDFNTYAGQDDSIPAYVAALCKEIEFVGRKAPATLRLHTVFFGGGTPSLLSPSQFKLIFETIRDHFDLAQSAEITMEANPGTVSVAQMAELRTLGINRISFGAQSANAEELRMLERAHSFLDVIEAVYGARRAGFDNVNLDLIYGLPEQSPETWERTLASVLALSPEHVSAYALTLEHGTPFGNWSARGLLPIPDPDAAAEMYEYASQSLEAAGYAQYEISNWAKTAGRESGKKEERCVPGSATRFEPRFSCRHNLQYWRCEPYLGLGAGAHGYSNGYRYSNVLRIKTYIARMEDFPTLISDAGESAKEEGAAALPGFPLSPATVNQHRQKLEDEMSEFMIMGLRLTREGVNGRAFRDRFGCQLAAVYRDQVNDLVRLGLLEWGEADPSEIAATTGTLRLTPRGRLLGNQVFLRFV